jgi:hypothetical protein
VELDQALVALQGTMTDIRDQLPEDRNQRARIERLEVRVEALEKRSA